MAAKVLLVLVAVVAFVSYGDSLKLPSYVSPCSRNDPDINACVLKSGNKMVAEIMKRGGDRKYNIPDLNPLRVTKLITDQNGLKLTLTDVKLNGLKDMSIISAKLDFKTRREEFEILIPRLEIISDYSVEGRILVLPIRGEGLANFTIPNLVAQMSHDYDLKKGKTGKDHIVNKNTVIKFNKTKGFISLENLFGNKDLSDNMNLVLNENSEQVISDVGPAVAEALGLVVKQIYSGLTTLVSFDEMYPETV